MALRPELQLNRCPPAIPTLRPTPLPFRLPQLLLPALSSLFVSRVPVRSPSLETKPRHPNSRSSHPATFQLRFPLNSDLNKSRTLPCFSPLFLLLGPLNACPVKRKSLDRYR